MNYGQPQPNEFVRENRYKNIKDQMLPSDDDNQLEPENKESDVEQSEYN